MTTKFEDSIAYREFPHRYEKWRLIYSTAGRPSRDEPKWEDGRLFLHVGYPHDGWTAYIISEVCDGYNILTSTTERRNEPTEGVVGFFSDLEDAGKYVIWNVGESLRVTCRIDPVGWQWEDSGLDPRVEQISLGKYESKYVIKSNPARYFILKAGGVQPENRLLPLTYGELDEILTAGIPGL